MWEMPSQLRGKPGICMPWPMREALPSLSLVLRLGALASVVGAGIGIGFAFWARQSDGIFLALVDSGLSWCF